MKRILSIALICCIAVSVISVQVFAANEDFGRDFYTDFEDFGEVVPKTTYYKIRNLETGSDETELFQFNNNSGTGTIEKYNYGDTHNNAAKITVPQNETAATQINFYPYNAQRSAVYGMSIYVPENANTLYLNTEGRYNDENSWSYGFQKLVYIDNQKMTVLKTNSSLLPDELKPGWYDIRLAFDYGKEGIKKDQRVYFYITLPDGTQKITHAGMAGMVANSSYIVGDLKRFQYGISGSSANEGTYGLDDMSVSHIKDMVVSHNVTDIDGVQELEISFNQDIYLGSANENSFITFKCGDEDMTGVTVTPIKRGGFIRGAKVSFDKPLDARCRYTYTVKQGVADLFGRRFGNEISNTFTLNTGTRFVSVTGITCGKYNAETKGLNITANIYNASWSKTIKIITALYKENVLIKAQINNVELESSNGKSLEVPLEFAELPSDFATDSNYNVRCFVWNSLESLEPIDGGFARWDNVGSAS